MQDTAGMAQHHLSIVVKYRDAEHKARCLAGEDEPEETVTFDHGWFEASGEPVTDPERIEQLMRNAGRPPA